MEKTRSDYSRAVRQQVTGKVLTTTCDFTATTWQDAEQVGKINIFDYVAYVAVRCESARLAVNPLPACAFAGSGQRLLPFI